MRYADAILSLKTKMDNLSLEINTY
jgi:hypothetical protein